MIPSFCARCLAEGRRLSWFRGRYYCKPCRKFVSGKRHVLSVASILKARAAAEESRARAYSPLPFRRLLPGEELPQTIHGTDISPGRDAVTEMQPPSTRSSYAQDEDDKIQPTGKRKLGAK